MNITNKSNNLFSNIFNPKHRNDVSGYLFYDNPTQNSGEFDVRNNPQMREESFGKEDSIASSRFNQGLAISGLWLLANRQENKSCQNKTITRLRITDCKTQSYNLSILKSSNRILGGKSI